MFSRVIVILGVAVLSTLGVTLSPAAELPGEKRQLGENALGFERALEIRDMNLALDYLTSMSASQRHTSQVLRLARDFWVVVNSENAPATTATVALTKRSQSIMLHGFRLAMPDMAKSSDLVSTRSIMRTFKTCMATASNRRLAWVSLADLLIVTNLQEAGPLCLLIANCHPDDFSEAPSRSLALIYYLTGRHDQVVRLREIRVPQLRAPLAEDKQEILMFEIALTYQELGTTEGMTMADKYVSLGLLSERNVNAARKIFDFSRGADADQNGGRKLPFKLPASWDPPSE